MADRSIVFRAPSIWNSLDTRLPILWKSSASVLQRFKVNYTTQSLDY